MSTIAELLVNISASTGQITAALAEVKKDLAEVAAEAKALSSEDVVVNVRTDGIATTLAELKAVEAARDRASGSSFLQSFMAAGPSRTGGYGGNAGVGRLIVDSVLASKGTSPNSTPIPVVIKSANGGQSGSSSGSSGLLDALGITAALKAAGGGGGLISKILGFGTGGFGLTALAGVGTLGGFAGFGAEHVATVGLGLAGTAVGGAIGGGILGAGALGVMGTGMLADAGGIGQAAGDVKNVTTVLTQYQTMAQALSKTLPTTAAGQTALNAALAGFAPAAQSAVLAASLTASQFHWMYDQVTAAAESIGANIINQAMTVGEKFLPALGAAATANTKVIQSALQPLFAWIGGPQGMGIFNQLMAEFQATLPEGMHAIVQGIEVFLNAINTASQYTGNLVLWINKFVTSLNTVAGQTKVNMFIHTMIGYFEEWWNLLKALGVTLYLIFHQSAGTGSDIITTITGLLDTLDKWLRGVGGAELHNLFAVHKSEINALITGVVALVAAFAQLYLAIAPTLTKVATAIITILDLAAKVPFAGWALAIGFVLSRMGLLTIALTGIRNLAIKAFGTSGIMSLVAGSSPAQVANTTALGVNTAAIEGLTTVMGGEDATSAVSGAGGATLASKIGLSSILAYLPLAALAAAVAGSIYLAVTDKNKKGGNVAWSSMLTSWHQIQTGAGAISTTVADLWKGKNPWTTPANTPESRALAQAAKANTISGRAAGDVGTFLDIIHKTGPFTPSGGKGGGGVAQAVHIVGTAKPVDVNVAGVRGPGGHSITTSAEAASAKAGQTTAAMAQAQNLAKPLAQIITNTLAGNGYSKTQITFLKDLFKDSGQMQSLSKDQGVSIKDVQNHVKTLATEAQDLPNFPKKTASAITGSNLATDIGRNVASALRGSPLKAQVTVKIIATASGKNQSLAITGTNG